MATNFLWGTRQSGVNLITTEANTLASGSATALGPEIDNRLANSAGWQMADLFLTIASNSSAFTAASYFNVAFLTKFDGTNYPTFTSGSSFKLALQNYLAGSIWINPATQSANVVYEGILRVLLPSTYFKTVLINQSGITLPSSGNTLVMYPTPEQY